MIVRFINSLFYFLIMRKYQKALALGTILASAGLMGCEENRTIEGTVKEEFGLIPTLSQSKGALFGNESVKLGNRTYGLVVQTKEGDYTINVLDDPGKSILVLEKAIEIGDKVRIDYQNQGMLLQDKIDDDRVGTVWSSHIKIIEKAKK